MDETRRGFLGKAGGSALGLGCGLSLLTSGCGGSDRGSESSSQWAMIIDVAKCDDDEVRAACAKACRESHNIPEIMDADDPEKPDEKEAIDWIWAESYEHVFPDQTHQHTSDDRKELPVLTLCNHCTRPSCVRVCPTGATWKRDSDGLVMMDMHRCIGCRYCMAACPYGARSFNWRDPRPHVAEGDASKWAKYPTRSKGVVEKCTFCAELVRSTNVDDGQTPLPHCVAAANAVQEGAMMFGKLTDANIEQTLEENNTICRRVGLGTGPNVFYIV